MVAPRRAKSRAPQPPASPHGPVELVQTPPDPEAWSLARLYANGDVRRLTVLDRNTVLVRNSADRPTRAVAAPAVKDEVTQEVKAAPRRRTTKATEKTETKPAPRRRRTAPKAETEAVTEHAPEFVSA